jgi:RNA polymerase subunit RPABC4/transcription elongation factor Spt4
MAYQELKSCPNCGRNCSQGSIDGFQCDGCLTKYCRNCSPKTAGNAYSCPKCGGTTIRESGLFSITDYDD